jgi:hypothetical protein
MPLSSAPLRGQSGLEPLGKLNIRILESGRKLYIREGKIESALTFFILHVSAFSNICLFIYLRAYAC